jgi:hypothetical protein
MAPTLHRASASLGTAVGLVVVSKGGVGGGACSIILNKAVP